MIGLPPNVAAREYGACVCCTWAHVWCLLFPPTWDCVIGSVTLQWCEVIVPLTSVASKCMHAPLLWSDALVGVVLDSFLPCSDHPTKV